MHLSWVIQRCSRAHTIKMHQTGEVQSQNGIFDAVYLDCGSLKRSVAVKSSEVMCIIAHFRMIFGLVNYGA